MCVHYRFIVNNYYTITVSGLRGHGQKPQRGIGESASKKLKLEQGPSFWTPNEVKTFLDKEGFGEFSEEFLKNEIEGWTLLKLNSGAMEELGIKKNIQQCKLLGKIEKLRHYSS